MAGLEALGAIVLFRTLGGHRFLNPEVKASHAMNFAWHVRGKS